ncbi:MAG: hypothetical protein GX596_12865, partial [Propionibacterium sp.]|nr:hypothetical protein [Propionibacterium sp.]
MSNRIRNWAVAGTFTLAAVGGLAAAAIATPGNDLPEPSSVNTTVTARPIGAPGPSASASVESPFAELNEGADTMTSDETMKTALSVSVSADSVSAPSPMSPKSVSPPSPKSPPSVSTVSPPSPVSP